jgi:hypothetical protein
LIAARCYQVFLRFARVFATRKRAALIVFFADDMLRGALLLCSAAR